jgi:hypothetical protein
MRYFITTPEWSGTIGFDDLPCCDAFHQHRLAKARFRLVKEDCIESWDLDPVDACLEGTLEVRARWTGYGPRTFWPSGTVTRAAHVVGHITFDGVRYPASDLSLAIGTLSIGP